MKWFWGLAGCGGGGGGGGENLNLDKLSGEEGLPKSRGSCGVVFRVPMKGGCRVQKALHLDLDEVGGEQRGLGLNKGCEVVWGS